MTSNVCGSTITLVYHCIILVWVLNMSVSGQVQTADKNKQKRRTEKPHIPRHTYHSLD